ncbi:hypothetical protein HPB51_020353 [Rhipicephalus microplus]|uniref:Uncharacterized protein n=1 Tax=Rhipicephalus microplus TaxID=6941 RepID=A0A9J6DWW7_RHIMP|nr:hypothetical protein HPB51_020353 [Rhipicephalus microplus]
MTPNTATRSQPNIVSPEIIAAAKTGSKARSTSHSKTRTKSVSIPIPLPVNLTKHPGEAWSYSGLTGIPATLQEGTFRQDGNYNHYRGESATTCFRDQQCQGGISGDDITIWRTRGSERAIQNRLQEATDIGIAYARPCSLTCSNKKSELAIIRARSITPPPQIVVQVNGVAALQVERARILDMNVQANGRVDYTVSLLSRQTKQILALLRRVSNRRSGLRERDLLRLVQAWVISRITYHLLFHILT